MNKHKVKRAIAQKRASLQKILNACEANGECRDLNEEEKKQYDTLMSEVEGLKRQLARMEEVGDEEEEEEEETETEARSAQAGSSRRVSDPDQFRGQSPAIRTGKKPYRLLRALAFAANGKAPNGLEGEISQEVRRRNPGKDWVGQFSMPIDPDPELRALMYPNYGKMHLRADLNTTQGTGGIFTVPELPMIDLLRPRMVIHRLGATFLTGMQGLFAIPRQNGKSTVGWIGDTISGGATASTPTLDQVPFSPKLAVDLTNISRQFINQTSVSAETFAMNDLAKTMAVEWDRVSINGLGSGSNQPLGIMQNTTIQSQSSALAIGANGGAIAWANVVNAETQVANANADMGRLAYLTSPALRGTMKQTVKVASSTFPIYLWEDGPNPGEGEINSYPAFATTNVPSNLTKGSGTNLSALIFGNWEDLIVASWDDGIDFLVNPYSNQASAAVTISMQMSVDSEVRHPESFALISDASYTAF